MTFFQTSLLGASAFAARLLSNILLNKILAVTVGPSGFALVGQLQNLLGIGHSLTGGFFATGLTRGIASLGNDEAAIVALCRTAIGTAIAASAITAAVALLFADSLATWFLLSASHRDAVVLAALVLPAAVVGLLLLAILNGRKLNKAHTIVSIAVSLASVALVGTLSWVWGIAGALAGIALSTAGTALFALLLSWREPWFTPARLIGRWDRPSLQLLLGPAIMAIVAACVAPVLQIGIRSDVIQALGVEAAGQWQALWKMSELFMLLFTTSLALYYLPRLAEIRSGRELQAEVLRVTGWIVPIAAVAALIVIAIREDAVRILLSREFTPVAALMPWQLGADVVKLGSWIVGYVMIARALVVPFIACEVSFAVLFYVSAKWLVGEHGLIGVSAAQLITYSVYWLVAGVIARQECLKLPALPAKIDGESRID